MGFTVTVSHPEKTGSMFKSYTSYLVKTLEHGYSVRRRYSDFEWLAELLGKNYPGMVIPALPEKTMGSGNEQALRSRMRGLGIFMNAVCSNSYLRGDPVLKAFMSVADQAGWEAAKKTAGQEEVSINTQLWVRDISASDIPGNTSRVLADVKKQLDPLERALRQLMEATKRLADKSALYAAEMAEMNSSFAAWAGHERAAEEGSERRNKSAAELTNVMGASERMFGAWNDILTFQPTINELLLHENVKFQHKQVGQLRGVLKHYESLQVEDAKLVKKLELMEAEVQVMAAKGRADKVAKMDIEVEQIKRQVKKSHQMVDLFVKGLFSSELQRFHTDKSALLRELTGQLSAAHFQFAKRLGVMWQGFIGEIKVDPQAMVEKARVVFSQSQGLDSFEAGDE